MHLEISYKVTLRNRDYQIFYKYLFKENAYLFQLQGQSIHIFIYSIMTSTFWNFRGSTSYYYIYYNIYNNKI